MQHFISVVSLVLSLNVCAGLLGLQLAIPPGFATSVWPPAGIALASVLIWKAPGLIGTWLASFLVNTLNQHGLSILPLESFLTPAWIATSSSFQAIIGAFLIRRFVGYPTRLNRTDRILKFLVLAGPVSCLISASFSISYLVSSGLIVPEASWVNWLTWWIGDTIGVIVFAPLMFLAFALPRHHWRSQALSVGLPLCLIILFTVLVYQQALRKEQESQYSKFQGQAKAFELALQSEIDTHVALLYNLRGFIYSDFDLKPEDFRRFASEALQQQSTLHGLSWNTYLKDHERLAFVNRMRQDYDPIPFMIRERHPTYGLVQAEPRDSYVVVTLIEPLEINQAALGFDVLSNPMRRDALERSVKAGLASATSPIRLVQETSEQKGVLIFLPAFHSASTPATEGERLDALAGYCVVVVRMGNLVDELLHRHQLERNQIRLYPQNQPDQLYFLNNDDTPLGLDLLKYQSEIQVGTDIWILEQEASRDSLGYSWGLYYVLTGGFLMSAVLGGVLLLLAGRSAEISREVHQRTKELQKSSELLAESQRIAQMGSWEWAHNGLDHSWSAEFYRLLDLNPNQKPSEELFLQQILPDHREDVEKALDAALRGQRLDIECTLRRLKDGQYRHLALRGERVLMVIIKLI